MLLLLTYTEPKTPNSGPTKTPQDHQDDNSPGVVINSQVTSPHSQIWLVLNWSNLPTDNYQFHMKMNGAIIFNIWCYYSLPTAPKMPETKALQEENNDAPSQVSTHDLGLIEGIWKLVLVHFQNTCVVCACFFGTTMC